jgi:hypothetical protein
MLAAALIGSLQESSATPGIMKRTGDLGDLWGENPLSVQEHPPDHQNAIDESCGRIWLTGE